MPRYIAETRTGLHIVLVESHEYDSNAKEASTHSVESQRVHAILN